MASRRRNLKLAYLTGFLQSDFNNIRICLPMVDKNGSKLNRLQSSLPEGLVVDTAWLEKEGYRSPSLS
jgi:hypothetical protein